MIRLKKFDYKKTVVIYLILASLGLILIMLLGSGIALIVNFILSITNIHIDQSVKYLFYIVIAHIITSLILTSMTARPKFEGAKQLTIFLLPTAAFFIVIIISLSSNYFYLITQQEQGNYIEGSTLRGTYQFAIAWLTGFFSGLITLIIGYIYQANVKTHASSL